MLFRIGGKLIVKNIQIFSKYFCINDPFLSHRVYIGKEEESVEKSNSPKSILASPINMIDSSENNKEKFNSPSHKVLQKDLLKITQSNSNQRKISKTQEDELTNISCTYKELMACTQSFTNVQDTVNIPMTELSGSPLRNITQVHKRETEVSLNIQNSDCGIEALCIKQGSLYDQNIKFVDDDDDDDYIG